MLRPFLIHDDILGGQPVYFTPHALCGLQLRGVVSVPVAGQARLIDRIVGRGIAVERAAWDAAFAALGGLAIRLIDENGDPVPLDEIAM